MNKFIKSIKEFFTLKIKCGKIFCNHQGDNNYNCKGCYHYKAFNN